jgi:2-polyprenyl-6-methoxyphenol hydroxylase-like FAD-dependent oxidoreductase
VAAHVVVVGGGAGGAGVALLLARAGVAVHLVERETSFARVFCGEGLMPAGIDALRQMGLGRCSMRCPSGSCAREHLDRWRGMFVVPEPVIELGNRAVRVVSQRHCWVALSRWR